jgi:hypothetical protein
VARGGGGGERATVTLDFLPDNIDHAPDGSLYVTGQNADPKQLLIDCPGGNCRHDTTVVKLDPMTMETRVVARLPANALSATERPHCRLATRFFSAAIGATRSPT